MTVAKPQTPKASAKLLRKGAIPTALTAALVSPFALYTLETLEGNIKEVYADKLADNLPTYCAGMTDRNAVVGTKLTSDFCEEVNKTTILRYGYKVLECTNWDYLTPKRLIGLTMFAINVGAPAACGSQAFAQINQGNVKQGCRLLSTKPNGQPNWSVASGKYVQGLQNRRKAEESLCYQ